LGRAARASQGGASIIDAACLNALGSDRTQVRVTVCGDGREVSVSPGVLAATLQTIRPPQASATIVSGDTCSVWSARAETATTSRQARAKASDAPTANAALTRPGYGRLTAGTRPLLYRHP
jgi:hypothetical protein